MDIADAETRALEEADGLYCKRVEGLWLEVRGYEPRGDKQEHFSYHYGNVRVTRERAAEILEKVS